MSIETMKLALDALEIEDSVEPWPKAYIDQLIATARNGLRQAIEQAEQAQPVAWMREGWGPDCGPYIEFYRDDEMGWRDKSEWTPLYTAPPPRQWVGLTDEEMKAVCAETWSYDPYVISRAIEAKLKEKNT
jgi:hypothetical protein